MQINLTSIQISFIFIMQIITNNNKSSVFMHISINIFIHDFSMISEANINAIYVYM